ncbi:MAG: ABC transporter ATP-binding protein [Roseburia sp.]
MSEKRTEKKEPLLRVEHLCCYFQKDGYEIKAVDDVSFDIREGEVFGLVGESGCGKTTTGRCIIQLYEISAGDIWFQGRHISAGRGSYEAAIRKAREAWKAGHMDAAACKSLCKAEKSRMMEALKEAGDCDRRYAAERVRAVREAKENVSEFASRAAYRSALRAAKRSRAAGGIQMIFQDSIASLNPRMTVRDIIAEGLIIRGIRDKRVLEERVKRMLELVGLSAEQGDRYPHEFSGGQRQRIGVARALIMEPELVIADEPVSALDVSIQAQVINLLNDLKRELGLTILFIAHDLSVVHYLSDRIGVMYGGHLVELADADELFSRPLHPYTRSLLSAIPMPDPHYEKKRQRLLYDPLLAHNYGDQKPEFREVLPDHFVRCDEVELMRYRADL